VPRPQQRPITFTIDGREVQAPEGTMLVDAAKHGDVEIPVFCYEPKLGQPVGACRMCLVEIEGMPKLQTGCSTPVKDGMVVHTLSPRARQAQEGVVEFLLLNHPLDCPVCDKGGECPLQDISFGWGRGTSRFVEPKRHFVKPLALSPTIAIDRERCILCYRCVRFSQEVAEDNLLVLLERGGDSYVGTFDGQPYEAPFTGNIVELCPVGALTSRPYRFKARPWDIEGAGSVCTLCPSQCNVTLTVRDERVLRVLARDHHEVDDGWLCDRGRFAYPALGHVGGAAEMAAGATRVAEPLVRDGGQLRPVSWERALQEAAAALKRAGGRTGAIVGGESTNEEGFLAARLLREGLGSPHIDSRRAGTLPLELHRALAAPALQASIPDLEFAHAVLVLDADPVRDMPIVHLRLRKGVRRHGMRLEYAGSEDMGAVRDMARELREQAGEEIVVLWGERLTAGPNGAQAAQALLDIASELSLAEIGGAGLLEIPAASNGRGLREAGALPNAGPGLAPPPQEGLDAQGIARALSGGELSALYLLHADPLADALPTGDASAGTARAGAPGGNGSCSHAPAAGRWRDALERASAVVAHASFLTDGLRQHADVVFPGEAYAEKEGTVVHPDGRIQRLRPAVAHPGAVRGTWSVIADLAARVGLDLGVLSGSMATAQLMAAVPFYAGLTLDEIGGRGVRWPEREAASAFGSEHQAADEAPAR
jgi:NADH-quinone oxidoreductase subunit G